MKLHSPCSEQGANGLCCASFPSNDLAEIIGMGSKLQHRDSRAFRRVHLYCRWIVNQRLRNILHKLFP